jgi:hypothetical protein
MLNMQSSEKVGGKSDAAAAAFRTAASLQPERAEPLQMLALRLHKAPRKKTRTAARKIASRALKIEPASPMVRLASAALRAHFRALRLRPRAPSAPKSSVPPPSAPPPFAPPPSALCRRVCAAGVCARWAPCVLVALC